MSGEAWFAIPIHRDDAKRAGETFGKWKDMGYRTAALIVDGDPKPDNCQRWTVREYKGWAWAVNYLSAALGRADWLVTGGADVYPDPKKTAKEIAAECAEYFKGTFAVMQPTGDAYGALAQSPITAAVSPWLGLEFRQRINGGKGPLWSEYPHYFADAELASVARMENCLWERPDVFQLHDHYLRRDETTPAHLEKWQATHDASKRLFEERTASGFPGHEVVKEASAA